MPLFSLVQMTFMDTATSQGFHGQLQLIQQKIRSEPVNPAWRVALFQVHCQTGNWQKALEQLQVFAQLNASGADFAQTYRLALQAEMARELVFAGHQSPQFLEPVEIWMTLLLDALHNDANADTATASDLRMQALHLAPAVPGKLNGSDFLWLGDSDSRLGPVCELLLDGCYCWIPYSQLIALTIGKPQNVCDLVWLPAQVQIRGQTPRSALVPARYPGPLKDLTDEHKGSLLTTWNEIHPGTWIGSGVKVVTTDNDEVALVDIRKIDFIHAVP